MARLLAVLVAVALLPACHREEAKPGAETAPSAAVPAVAAPASSAARAEYHEAQFDLALVPAGPLTEGKPGVMEVRLSAKGGYHVNDKYPYKFKVDPAPGLKWGSDVFTKDALTLEEKQATMKVDVVPEEQGTRAVSGTFSFSVCSPERCLVEKRALAANVLVLGRTGKRND
ncbi:MAG TPA: hypothetical protein VHE30_23295 [Polyangiaceae bacterium]|nr:hypothetical protein [Polyangiaceae bacterium]